MRHVTTLPYQESTIAGHSIMYRIAMGLQAGRKVLKRPACIRFHGVRVWAACRTIVVLRRRVTGGIEESICCAFRRPVRSVL